MSDPNLVSEEIQQTDPIQQLEPIQQSEPSVEKTAAPAPAPVPGSPRLVNPNLSASLIADQAALENDLVQAQELAADFQRQLAGKTNEYAQLKQIFARTQANLAHLEQGIMELRAERHRLANEAMRAVALELKVTSLTAERDRLRADLEAVRHALVKKVDELTVQLWQRDRRIAELVFESVKMRKSLEESRGRIPESPRPLIQPGDLDSDVASEIEITRTERPKRFR
jgi:chromosome segregation ATPase